MTIDAAGNVYVFHVLESEADLDPGPGVVMVYPCGEGCLNGFLAKYTSQGEYLWSVPLNNATDMLALRDVAVDEAAGYVALVGSYLGPLDVDPAPGPALANVNDHHGFIALYDLDGNFLDATPIGSIQGTVDFNSVLFDADHQLVIGGNVFSSPNMDPVGVTQLSGGPSAFIARYSIPFDLLWGGVHEESTGGISDMKWAPDGDLVVCGTVKGHEVDFDFGPATTASNVGVVRYSGFVARYAYEAVPALEWVTTTGNSSTISSMFDISVDENGEVLAQGRYNVVQGGTPMDLDPGPGVNQVAAPDGSTSDFKYLVKYAADGAYQWGYAMREEGWSGWGGVYCGHGQAVVAGSFDPYWEDILFLDGDEIISVEPCQWSGHADSWILVFDSNTGAQLQSLIGDSLCGFWTPIMDLEGTAEGEIITYGYFENGFDPAFSLGEDPLTEAGGYYIGRYALDDLSTGGIGLLPLGGEALGQILTGLQVLDAQGRPVRSLPVKETMQQVILRMQAAGLPAGVYTIAGTDAGYHTMARRVCILP
jgi:hypothetical protein